MNEEENFRKEKPEFKIPYLYFIGVVIVLCAINLFLSIQNSNLQNKISDLEKVNQSNSEDLLFAGMTYNTFAFIHESKQSDFNYVNSTTKEARNNWKLLAGLKDPQFIEINKKFNDSTKSERESYKLYSSIEERIYQITQEKYQKKFGLD